MYAKTSAGGVKKKKERVEVRWRASAGSGYLSCSPPALSANWAARCPDPDPRPIHGVPFSRPWRTAGSSLWVPPPTLGRTMRGHHLAAHHLDIHPHVWQWPPVAPERRTMGRRAWQKWLRGFLKCSTRSGRPRCINWTFWHPESGVRIDPGARRRAVMRFKLDSCETASTTGSIVALIITVDLFILEYFNVIILYTFIFLEEILHLHSLTATHVPCKWLLIIK